MVTFPAPEGRRSFYLPQAQSLLRLGHNQSRKLQFSPFCVSLNFPWWLAGRWKVLCPGGSCHPRSHERCLEGAVLQWVSGELWVRAAALSCTALLWLGQLLSSALSLPGDMCVLGSAPSQRREWLLMPGLLHELV